MNAPMKTIAAVAALLTPAASFADMLDERGLNRADYARSETPVDVGVPSPVDQPTVFFLNLTDGEQVTSPFLAEFGLLGMMLAGADGGDQEGYGHHHLLIDATVDQLEPGQPIPRDDQHRHFPDRGDWIMLDLAPGKHTLQLVMGNGSHVPHDPPVASDVITVQVVEETDGDSMM